MSWFWIGLGLVVGLPATVILLLLFFYLYLRWKYLGAIERIFQERPLFNIPRGQPVNTGTDVRFPTADGLTLVGCYFRTAVARRQGVILFGLEFGSNRWASVPYCEHLLANGFDVFTFENRNQGDSDPQAGYEPLQWVTNFEVIDFQAAVAYLKSREDANPRGIGFFGISKGGSAGLLAAARDPYVRCFVTDGIFGTYTTMVPYMRKWISIYSKSYRIQKLVPTPFYGLIGRNALRRIGRARGCRFPHLERALPKLSPRPWLMIHGEGDTYIKPEMARALFDLAAEPKELWLVEGAKHNQALHLAGDEYRRRVLEFFQRHLPDPKRAGVQPALVEIT